MYQNHSSKQKIKAKKNLKKAKKLESENIKKGKKTIYDLKR